MNSLTESFILMRNFLHRLQVASKFMPVSSLIIGEFTVINPNPKKGVIVVTEIM